MYRIILKKVFIGTIALLGPFLLLNSINKTNLIFFSCLISLSFYLINSILKNYIFKLVVVTLTILTIFISIIIIPYSFYITWFQFINTKIPDGIITTQIIYILSFIWGYYLGKLNSENIFRNIIFMLTILILIISFYIKYNFIHYILIVLMICPVIYNLLEFNSKEKILYIILLLIIVFIITSLSYLVSNNKGSKFIDTTSHKIRTFINKIVPKYNLLSTIPGIVDNYDNKTGKQPLLIPNSIFKVSGIPGSQYYLRLKINNNKKSILLSKKIVKQNVKSTNFLKITILTDFIPILPVTLETIDTNLFYLPQDKDKTLKLSVPLSKDEYYIIYEGESSEIIKNVTIQIPKVSNKVIDLAMQLKANSEIDTINNIRQYLTNNYLYNTDTKESETYITDFLFSTKEGFCIHFTRAFIILAKLNGINAREVSGYLARIPYDDDNYKTDINEVIVKGTDAHLWPEVLINGKWKTFEVTPPYISYIKPPITYNVVNDSKTKDIENNRYNFYLLKYVILTIFLVLILILLFIKNSNNKWYLYKLLKLSAKKGIPHPKYIGWIKWNEMILSSLEIKELILENIYNQRPLTSKDNIKLKKFIKSIK